MWDLLLALVLNNLPGPGAPIQAAATGHVPLAAALQQWELERTLDSDVGGLPLVMERGAPTFEEVPFGDAPVVALRIPAGGRVRVPTELVPQGPGFLDGFTVILDVRFEDGRWLRAPVLQTDGDDDDDAEAEVVVKQRGKLAVFGVGGDRGGKVVPGQWHRLAMVVDGAAGTVVHYVDGQRAASGKRTIDDSRWSLEPELVLFSDDEGGPRPNVWLAALQVHGAPLSPEAIAALGAARPGGIARPDAASADAAANGIAFAARDATAATARGQLATVRWSSQGAAGDLALALVGPGGARRALGAVPIAAGEASFRVPLDLPAGAWRVAATTKAGEALGPRVEAAAPADDGRALGVDLVTNGSFASGLEGWDVSGQVAVLSQRIVGRQGDYRVTQRIDLGARGVSAQLADQGLVVEASAILARKDASGRFDDRGELVVRFLGAAGQDLGRLRSLSVDAPEWTRRAVRGLVPAGTRTLEVGIEAVQRKAPKNEVGADDIQLRLVSDATPALLRLSKQPILHPSDDPQTLTALFETDRTDAWPVVVWSKAGGPEQRAAPAVRTTVSPRHLVHEARIGPLEPGVAYTYRVEVGPWRSPSWPLTGPREATAEAPLRIAWLADNQHGWQTFREMVPAIAAARPDFAVLAGDIVQHGHMLREWQTEWFTSLSVAGFAQSVPIWFARGNHDGEHALSYAYTSMPGNAAWYATTRGGARIIVLDTEAEHGVVPEQLAWLRAELQSPASRDADFRIVTFHKAPFSNRWSHKTSTYDGEDWVRQWWVPVFEELGVDLVIAGHAHAYQRMDLGGVRYLVVGGAGGWLDKYKTARWPMDKDLPVHHWALMELAAGRISWTAKDADGAVIDQFTLRAPKRGKAAGR